MINNQNLEQEVGNESFNWKYALREAIREPSFYYGISKGLIAYSLMDDKIGIHGLESLATYLFSTGMVELVFGTIFGMLNITNTGEKQKRQDLRKLFGKLPIEISIPRAMYKLIKDKDDIQI